jgi:hypothetical protein
VILDEARKSQQYKTDTRGSDPAREFVDGERPTLTGHLTACA